jgi:photosystem II stability/assembly factor-like uncharacterized protein
LLIARPTSPLATCPLVPRRGRRESKAGGSFEFLFMSKLKLFIIVLGLILLTTACALPFASAPKEEGGIFKSFDYGENWEHKNIAVIADKKTNISDVSTKEIVFDFSDHSLVYLATRGQGLYLSENGGEEWRQIFNTGFISSVALDNNSRGVIYIAVANKIYKSIDQGKTWRTIYLENRPAVQITQVAVDPKSSQRLLMATTAGEIYQSTDAGESWQSSFETKNNVRKILINRKNSKIIYAATLSAGIFKSEDGGIRWRNLKENYQQIDAGTLQYRFLTFDPGVSDGLFFASNSGIIRTVNGGETWQELKLLTPKNAATINTVALDSKNNLHIYYATNDTIYRTFDGGKTWLSAKAPTGRAVSFLTVDFDTPSIVYLGAAIINGKPFFFL